MHTMEQYDLTNNKGLAKAAGVLSDNLLLVNPGLALGKYLIDKVTDLTKTWAVQRETAEKLIKKGKEDGVDEMEITMDNHRGFKMNVPIDGVQINTHLGANEKMVVKVKYK